jgi:hypothetical protein
MQLNSSNLNYCHFCVNKVSDKVSFNFNIINSNLYQKYSSSQNYYFSKDINDILQN